MNISIGSFEAKTHFPALLRRIAKGEKITITRRGVPVAMISPVPGKGGENVGEAVQKMLAFRDKEGPVLRGISARELIEEGRKF